MARVTTTVARGTRRSVAIHDDGQRVTVELSRWLQFRKWRAKIKLGKRKGQALDPSITMPLDAIRKVRYSPARAFWPGRLVIDAPGHNDHWTPTGRQRKHKIRFTYWRREGFAMLVLKLDLLTPGDVCSAGLFGWRRPARMPDRVSEHGTPRQARRGEVVRRLSDERPSRLDRTPTAAPDVPPPAVIPGPMADAARAAHRRRVAGVPPPNVRR